MYLKASQVAERYGVDISTIWRWSKNPKTGFPQPRYCGDECVSVGFGEMRKGSIARWRTRDLALYDLQQSLLLDDDLEDAKQAAVLAALRRRFPALNSAPGELEQAAQAAYQHKHTVLMRAKVNAGWPAAVARDMATSDLRGFV